MKELIIGLICVMGANIIFGSTKNSLLEGFDFKKFIKGLIKAVLIALGMALIYVAGYYNPQIMAINIGGVDMNLMQGIEAIIIAGIMGYGYKALINAKDLLSIKIEGSEATATLEETIEEIHHVEEPKIEKEGVEDEVTISR